VIDYKFPDESSLIKGYQHLHIPIDDVEDENLIEWFPKSNTFIEQGLNYWRHDVQQSSADKTQGRDIGAGSGVLVHW
jgi:dual specificity phosphatase 12